MSSRIINWLSYIGFDYVDDLHWFAGPTYFLPFVSSSLLCMELGQVVEEVNFQTSFRLTKHIANDF
jgi:hypothetical protein